MLEVVEIEVLLAVRVKRRVEAVQVEVVEVIVHVCKMVRWRLVIQLSALCAESVRGVGTAVRRRCGGNRGLRREEVDDPEVGGHD